MTAARSSSPVAPVREARSARRVFRNVSPLAAFLSYHSVSEGGPPPLALKPDTFERQLAALRRWGYRSGGCRELEQLADGRRPGARCTFLTFDDGFRDTFEQAFPLLRAYRFTALVFLVPPLVDTGAILSWPEMRGWHERSRAPFFSVGWGEVEEMAEAGIEFGSHTCDHRYLPDLGDEELRQELLDSRRRIAERLGRCETIAYPYGACTRRVVSAAIDAGYSFGFTFPYCEAHVGWQRGATRMSIPRIGIEERDDERRFRLKLSAAGRRLLLSPVKGWMRAAKPRWHRARGAPGLAPAGRAEEGWR